MIEELNEKKNSGRNYCNKKGQTRTSALSGGGMRTYCSIREQNTYKKSVMDFLHTFKLN